MMFPTILVTSALLFAPAGADERCPVELPRTPAVATANDFRPARRACQYFSPQECRVRARPRPEAPHQATYVLDCVKYPPNRRATSGEDRPRVDPREAQLARLKRSDWIDGVALVVPADSPCGSPEKVRDKLGDLFPGLMRARSELAERQARLQVWSLSYDDGGFAIVTGPGVSSPTAGASPGKLPEVVCRGPVEVDGQASQPKTWTIVGRCTAGPPPPISDSCPHSTGSVMPTEIPKLLREDPSDPAVGYLTHLSDTATKVHDLEASPRKSARAKKRRRAEPPERKPLTCRESRLPVPQDQQIAVWKGARNLFRRTAAQQEADGCRVMPADLDPDGLVLDLVREYWPDPADRAMLDLLWRADPDLGQALLEALDTSGGPVPALRATTLREVVQPALAAGPRGFQVGDVEVYETDRQRLLARIDAARPAVPEIRHGAAVAREAYAALRTTWTEWPDHARDTLPELEARRRLMSRALRLDDLRGGERKSGKALMLELMGLVQRIEQDPMHEVYQDAAEIEGLVTEDAAGLAGQCEAVIREVELAAPPPMNLEAALLDPLTFRERRGALTAAHRRLDEDVCGKAVERAGLLEQQVRNLGVISRRVDPHAENLPRNEESRRLLAKTDVWLDRVGIQRPE